MQDGWTALHMAAQGGNVDVVKLLLKAKAHVNIQAKVHTVHYILSRLAHSHMKDEGTFRECWVHVYLFSIINKQIYAHNN